MGKIALTTMKILNDRVFRYTAWQYEVNYITQNTRIKRT